MSCPKGGRSVQLCSLVCETVFASERVVTPSLFGVILEWGLSVHFAILARLHTVLFTLLRDHMVNSPLENCSK